MSESPFRILGTPSPGGVLVVSDHASNHVPADIRLGIDPALLDQHVGVDIGVRQIGEMLAFQPGIGAFQCTFSRLVCDVNRDEHAPGAVPIASDGHAIPGNALDHAGHLARLDRFYHPYHRALADQLERCPPALIVSLHSFTPQLATRPEESRPWHVGVLYNADDRAARLAIALMEADGLCVGDQQPYSGRLLNYTMNRHAEPKRLPYLGIEIRQDQIVDAAGQAAWAERLLPIIRKIVAEIA